MRLFALAQCYTLRDLFRQRQLIAVLVRRDVMGRYQGSYLGILWSFFNPLLMLLVYTFVFGVVFNARWGQHEGSRAEFALVLFGGLIVFNVFAECINKAPALVAGNVSYVKKVVFPLHVLPVVSLGGAMFHAAISLGIWVVAYIVFLGMPPWTIVATPLVLLPVALWALGLGWLLASLGVYLRDVSQVVGVLTTVLMFMSPIFYPLSAIPASLRHYLALNPLAISIEQMRGVIYFGVLPDLLAYCGVLGVSAAVAWMGLAWFQKTRGGFADVL